MPLDQRPREPQNCVFQETCLGSIFRPQKLERFGTFASTGKSSPQTLRLSRVASFGETFVIFPAKGHPPKPSPAGTFFRTSRKNAIFARSRYDRMRLYPTQTRAFLKKRIHGLSSGQSRGLQLICDERNTRSGWGMRIVARPSSLVRLVMPNGDPFGLSGYASVTL